MTIEHSVIDDPDIHEPKGVSTAGDGDVYVADGLGTGVWRALSEFSGAMVITDNSSAQAITAAVDTSLGDFSDYVQVVNWTTGELGKLTFSTNQLTLPANGGGLYFATFYCNVQSDSNNTDVAVKFAINGASGVARRPRMRLASSSTYYNLAAHGLVRLDDSDVVDLYAASSLTANITFQDAVFSLNRVGE
jgi:hypothetical protein